MTTATRGIDPEIESRFVRIETRLDSMATKEDLANSVGDLRTDMATRFGELDTRLEARFGEQDAKFEARFGELKTEIANLKIDNANLRTEMIRWIVGTVAVGSTIVVSLVTVIDRLLG